MPIGGFRKKLVESAGCRSDYYLFNRNLAYRRCNSASYVRNYCAMHKNSAVRYMLISAPHRARKTARAPVLLGRDFRRIERWSCKRPDVVGRLVCRRCRGAPEDGVVEVGPEHGLRRRQPFRRELGLPPADHLA